MWHRQCVMSEAILSLNREESMCTEAQRLHPCRAELILIVEAWCRRFRPSTPGLPVEFLCSATCHGDMWFRPVCWSECEVLESRAGHACAWSAAAPSGGCISAASLSRARVPCQRLHLLRLSPLPD